MATWDQFRQCDGCGYDFATGEGERGCGWGSVRTSPRSWTCSVRAVASTTSRWRETRPVPTRSRASMPRRHSLTWRTTGGGQRPLQLDPLDQARMRLEYAVMFRM
jgi:hypothetical protein